MAQIETPQSLDASSDENEDEKTYSGSEYNSDSSSANPPCKRKPYKQSEISNKYYIESSDEEEEIIETPSIKWGPISGKTGKDRYPEYIKISDSVYQNYLLKTPYDFFKLLFSDEIFDIIVIETNRYAMQTIEKMDVKPGWYDTNKEEIEVFLGVILTLLPSVKSYWDGMQAELYRSKVISKMKQDRFKMLLKMWHFNNNDVKTNDRLGKISPIIKVLERNFQKVINPGEKLYVDESVIPFRRGFKPKYRYHFGLRCINLCLSNGYTYKLLIHFGKNLELKNEVPSSAIMILMEGLLNEARILFTKEQHTSIHLAYELLKHRTYLVGPLNSKKLINPKDLMKHKLKKGENVALESDGIVVQKWKNAWNSDVLVLSTKYSDEMVLDFDKKGIMSERPRSVYELSKCTSNINSESFDKMLEQIKEYHMVRLSCGTKWYRRLAIEFLMEKTLVNAYILHQDVTNEQMDILDFRKQVTNTLLTMN